MHECRCFGTLGMKCGFDLGYTRVVKSIWMCFFYVNGDNFSFMIISFFLYSFVAKQHRMLLQGLWETVKV